MSDFLTKRRILLAKEESSYGVDSSPNVSNNAIDAKNIKVSYLGDVLERDNVRNDLSPQAPVLGKRYIEVTFQCELKGSGTAGTAPAIGDLLEACGFNEGVDVGSSVVYTPESVSHKSITIYVYDIGASGAGNTILHKITGARGNVNIVMEAGQIAKLEFTFQGLYNAKTDVATPSTPTYESTKPPVVKSSNFTLNGVTSLVVQSINIDMANELTLADDINAASSIKSVEITGRRPNGNFNPEAIKVATYDFNTDWINATARALSVVVGSAAGNKCTISAPKVTIDQINDGDRSGIKTDEMPFRCSANSSDDEVELKFE